MRHPDGIPRLDTQDILALRPEMGRPKPGLDALNVLEEQEASNAFGNVKNVLTVMLRGAECQFHCLMCDLWKHTHLEATPAGAIAAQVRSALRTSLRTDWIKLYNASNFFAPINVPQQDLDTLPSLLNGFERVIVENHPKLLGPRIEAFRSALHGRLEVAMGLETIHPEILPRLNKRMLSEDFRRACEWLTARDIDARTFILLRPPGLSEREGIEWCCKSIEFAIDCGARHVSVIPVRAGNGSIEHLQQLGHFQSPLASSLEAVAQHFAGDSRCVFSMDLWDWPRLRGTCARCSESRQTQLHHFNLTQRPFLRSECPCETGNTETH